MFHKHIHAANWIKELKGYGVTEGRNGETLEGLDYYDLRALVVRSKCTGIWKLRRVLGSDGKSQMVFAQTSG